MKAIIQDRYGSPDVLQLGEIDKPVVGDDEMLIRVHAAGIDQGVWHLMAGLPYLIRIAGFGLRAPKNPVRGLDVAGRVEAVGENVTEFQPGDEVFGTCNGSFAEYALRPRGPARAQAGEPRLRAGSGRPHLGLRRPPGRSRPGEGSTRSASPDHRRGGRRGDVRRPAGQGVRRRGDRGLPAQAKTDLVRSIGADRVIDYTREDFVDGRNRYDVILDIAGNRSLSHLRRALTREGTLVIVGGEGGGKWLGGIDRQLRAQLLSPFVRQKLGTWISKERREDLEELRELLEAGKLMPIVDRTFPLSEVPEAIRYLREGRARGKVVIVV